MYKLIIVLFCLLLISCSQEQQNAITIQDTWIREAPPTAFAMAGYLTINNTTTQDRILTFAKSKHFNAIEFHRTVIKDGVAKMRRHDELLIPAGKSLEFKPGDFHLMLMGPKTAFKTNDEVTITLCFKNADKIEEVDISMPVKKPEAN